MNKYLLNLFKQFNDAMGIENADIFSQNYWEACTLWLKGLESNSRMYQEFIEYLGFDINSTDATELRKGKYDSIGMPYTRIITPYTEHLEDMHDIVMFQGEPLLIGSIILREQVVGTYFTHNPYDLKHLECFDYFDSVGKDYCIGVFGMNDDRDKEQKIKTLDDYGFKFLSHSKVEYETRDNSYFYVVRSKYKTKINKKLR